MIRLFSQIFGIIQWLFTQTLQKYQKFDKYQNFDVMNGFEIFQIIQWVMILYVSQTRQVYGNYVEPVPWGLEKYQKFDKYQNFDVK